MPASRSTRATAKKATAANTAANGDGSVEGAVVPAEDAFDFNFDEIVEAETKQAADRPFRFPLKGTVYELPNARVVSFRQARMLDEDALEALAEVAAPELVALLADQPAPAVLKLVNAWLAHAGIGGGKTLASPTS